MVRPDITVMVDWAYKSTPNLFKWMISCRSGACGWPQNMLLFKLVPCHSPIEEHMANPRASSCSNLWSYVIQEHNLLTPRCAVVQTDLLSFRSTLLTPTRECSCSSWWTTGCWSLSVASLPAAKSPWCSRQKEGGKHKFLLSGDIPLHLHHYNTIQYNTINLYYLFREIGLQWDVIRWRQFTHQSLHWVHVYWH